MAGKAAKTVTEDNTLNIRVAVKALKDTGIREELNLLLASLKGEFEKKVEETFVNINNADRFTEAWDTVNLLVDGKKQPNLRKLLLLKVVNELHSGVNVTAKNKKEIESRIRTVKDSQLRTLLLNKLKESSEVVL